MNSVEENWLWDSAVYSNKSANVSRNTYFGVLVSRIIRYFGICNNFDSFNKRVEMIVSYFVNLNIDIRYLRNRFHNIKNIIYKIAVIFDWLGYICIRSILLTFFYGLWKWKSFIKAHFMIIICLDLSQLINNFTKIISFIKEKTFFTKIISVIREKT